MNVTEKLMYGIYSAALGTVTTLVVRKSMQAGWKLVTGDEPPEPGDPEVPAREAFIWAIASGVGLGVAQLATSRFTARHWMQVGNKPAPKETQFKIGKK